MAVSVDAHRYIFISVMLCESGGPIGKVGEPRMFCNYNAVHVGGFDDGRVNIVVRDGDDATHWREYAQRTTVDDARRIMAQLDALGIPSRIPEAKGVFDTSDDGTKLFFRVKAGLDHHGQPKGATEVDISMQSSGFDGADAERLRALFRDLFALAKFDAYSPIVYGSY